MGPAFTAVSFLLAFVAGRQSLGAGISVICGVGYVYGIVRCNFFDPVTHFMFEASLAGLYLARVVLPRYATIPPPGERVWLWTRVLIFWPLLVLAGTALIFPQHPLIQLVGLRAAVWFLPFLVFGAGATPRDLGRIAVTLAGLNLLALAFGIGEYIMGVQAFYPQNAASEIIYRSQDVGGGNFRIPATFAHAAAYGGTMVGSLPIIFGRWRVPGVGTIEKLLLLAGVMAAAAGTFLCGSRSPVLVLFFLGLVAVWILRASPFYMIALGAAAIAIGAIVAGDERLQRYESLQDTEYVGERINGSANVGVLDFFTDYPLGNGLGGGGGTSIPSFLSEYPVNQIGAENEYVRIGLEQGLGGVVLWLVFIGWTLTHSRMRAGNWEPGAHMMMAFVFFTWATAWIGTGVLLGIPGSCILLFMMGYLGREAPRRVGPKENA